MGCRGRFLGISALAVASISSSAHADPNTHDGVYLRGGVGLAYLLDQGSYTSDGVTTKYTRRGLGLAGEIAVGGAPKPGVVVGAAVQEGLFPSPSYKIKGAATVGTYTQQTTVTTFGPFIDYYPDAKKGFHLQGSVGLGWLSQQDVFRGTSSDTPFGVAASVGIGNEWWVADRVSVGGLFRVQGIAAFSSDVGAKQSDLVLIPALLATVTYQ